MNTPIVFDLWNVDFHFVPPSVKFNIDGKGHIETIAWPDAGYGNAFLALPDDNGHITSGKQLFGNFTDQPPCPPSEKRCENGFRALAVYDSNNDNVIDSRDPIWSKLRLWTDSNMNGKVDLGELTALDLGITSISLNYTPTDKYVAYGLLRYQGSVTGLADSTIYDVFLPSIK